MKVFLPKLILEEQAGFVTRRLILDRILIIQEMLYSANTNKVAGT